MTMTWHTVRMGRRATFVLVSWTALVVPAATAAATTPPTTPVDNSVFVDEKDKNPPTYAAPITTLGKLPVLLPFPEARTVEPRILLGSIEIPAIHISKPLMEGVSLNTLDIGPGHAPGSAMPGELGNAVIGGHRTSHDHPFMDLDLLKPGDEVIFNVGESRYTYLVESTEIITPDQLRVVQQEQRYTATLFACHPKGSTRERIIVHLRFAP